MSDLVLFNPRAVQDEVNPAGYCLNCIKKHSSMAHGLLVEIEQRAMQGSPLTDKKIREKMSQTFEQMVHIEDHTVVKMPVDKNTRKTLSAISSQANAIRAKLKQGQWAIDVEGNVPKGDINDITEMRLMTKKLQRFNDKAIVDFGCGDCNIKNIRKLRGQVFSNQKSLPDVNEPITGNNFNNSDENINEINGEIMSSIQNTTQKIGSTVGGNTDQVLSMVTEPVFSKLIGLDRSTISEILNPQILASLSEGWIFDLIFSPGFSLLGQLLVGLGMMSLGPRFLTSSARGQKEIVHYGAALAGAILRTSPGKVAAMMSELGSVGRLALSNPRAAALAPFRSPQQIQSEVARRTQIPGLSGLSGLGFPRSLQASLNTDEVEVPLPSKQARYRIA